MSSSLLYKLLFLMLSGPVLFRGLTPSLMPYYISTNLEGDRKSSNDLEKGVQASLELSSNKATSRNESKDKRIARLIVFYRTVAGLILLAEAGLFIASLFGRQANGVFEFVVDNFCPVGPSAADLSTLSSSFVIGYIILQVGGLIRVGAYRTIEAVSKDAALTPENKPITQGPYSVVRHPHHSGLVLIALGFIILQTDPYGPFLSCGFYTRYPLLAGIFVVWMVIAIWCIYRLVFVHIDSEEMDLKEIFGEESWENYCRNVPYKLIPKRF